MAGFTPLRTVVGDDESAFQPLREVNLGLAPQRGLISAALSSGTDQLQGLGYSALGGAADLLGANSVRDWANEQARRNSIDAALNGRPDLERIEDQTLGTALPFAAYQTLKQAPLMGAIAGAQLVPGLGQAATATGLARLGAVAPRVIGGGGLEAGASMAARRAALAQGADFGASAIVGSGLGFGSLYGESVEGGDPSPFKALALAPLYGVAEAALPSAVKGAFRAPERLAGGLGTRMLKAGGLGAVGESATEGFQNELEMSMRGDLSDEEKFSRRLNSMVTGGVVGGSLGSIGGIPGQRQARTVDDGLFDLTSPGGAPTYNLVTQPDPLQQRINQGLGIQRNTPKDYAKIFEGAASEGSGQFVTDPATGQERELDMGEYYALSTGVALAQQSAKRQEQAKQAQLAAQEEIDATATAYGIKPVDIGGQVAFDVLGGRVYGQSTLNQIVSDLITANQSKPEGQRIIEQAVINAGLTNFDGKPVGSAKQVASKVNSALKALNLSEATEPQAAAAILNDQIAQLVAAGKNEADPKLGKLAVAFEALTGGQTPPALTAKPKESGNAGQTSAPRQPATASVAAGNPVVPGSVANTRPVPAGNAGLDRNATGTGARSQQAGAVANSSGERTAPVGERKTLKVQRSTAKSDPFQVTEDANDALEIARATGNASELEAQAEEDAGLRMDNELAGDEDAQNKAINAILRQRFGDSAEGLRQAEIAQAYLVALKKAPRGSKLKVQEGIGRRFGVKAVTVRAYGNPNELVKAGKQLGYTEQQVRDLLEVKDNTKESQTDVEENQNEIEAAVNQRNDVQVETGDKESGLAADGPRGQMSDSSLTGQLAGEFGDNAEEGGSLGFGMDDSNTWKLANARSGAGDLANARVETYANAVQSAMERIDALQETLNEFETDGLDEAAEDVRALIDKENVALQKAIEAYQEFLNKEQGKKSAAKKPETAAPAKAPKKAKAETSTAVTTVSAGQQLWNSLREQMPDLVAYETLSKNEQGYLDDLAVRTNGKPVVAKELGLQELMARTEALPDESNIIDVEARVIEETVGREVAKLPDARVERLEKHYGLKRDSAEFLAKVKEDIVAYATKGAEAVAAAVRDIIKALHSGVLSVAMIFNPVTITPPQAVIFDDVVLEQTREIRAEVPANAAARMSDGAKEAYSILYPSIKDQLQREDKLMVIVDKPNARVFLFKPDGSLLIDKKVLMGAAKGDLYKGNNALPQNRITPAGLFTLGLRDAARSPAEAKTAGEYDFQKVFVLNKAIEGEYSITMMHSVWTKEKDAQARLNALEKEGAGDSRYSFGCINVDKRLYASLVKNHLSQMDGAPMFVVPENSADTAEFLKGATAQNKSGADGLTRTTFTPATETTRTTTRVPRSSMQMASADSAQPGKEEKYLFGKAPEVTKPYTAKQLLAEIKDFMRTDIPGRKLMVFDTLDDMLNSDIADLRALAKVISNAGAYGVATDGVAYLIANRIQQGRARSTFLHEVGAHLGLENLLPRRTYEQLVDQLVEWGMKNDGSLESTLARRARDRVKAAKTPKEDQEAELLAYFIEEAIDAGINPTAVEKLEGPLGAWFRTLWAAFKVAIRRLGFKPESLTAHDVVNLAYGAARLEVAGTWHGTAANFRKFSNKFMGAGEGNQAYGWGAYVAQAVGIAKDYWRADVRRKTTDGAKALVNYQGWELASDVRSPLGLETLLPAGEVVNKQFAGAVADLVETYGVDTLELLNPKTGEIKEVYVGGVSPEGNLLRVDLAIDQEEELLDWSKPMAEQSDTVKAAFEKFSTDVLNRPKPDWSKAGRFRGADYYMDLGIELTGIDPTTKQEVAQVQKAASEWLDANGVKGIKYFDANSRTDQLDLYSARFTKDGKFISGPDALREEYFKPGQLVDGYGGPDKVIRYNKPDTPYGASGWSVTVIRVDANGNPRPGERERTHSTNPGFREIQAVLRNRGWQLDETKRTRNIVVFNDENMIRVGSEVRANPQRMRFGKGSSGAAPEGVVTKTISRLPPQARAPVGNVWRNINRWTRKGLDRVVFTADLLQTAGKQGLLSATKFQRLLEMRGAMARDIELDVEKVADLYAAVPEKERGYGPGSVNEFIFDSTRTGKWGYDNGNFKADGDMAQRFDALSEESRRFVEAVFDHGKQMLALKKQTVLDSTNSIYDTLIAKETDPKAKAKLEREKAAELAKFQRLFAIREGLPYAPIKRVGDYVVIAKSDAYLKAEEEGNAAELRKLEKDPDHYHVSFMESENEAARLQEQLEEQGFFKGGSVEYAEKEQLRDRLFGGESMLNAVTKLKGLVDAQIDDDTSKQEKAAVAKMQRLVSDLYLQTLAENSARKTEMRRRGVAGEVDMLKSFTMQGRADAQFLASVKYASQTQDVIQEMRKQVKSGGAGTRNRRSELFNEIMARYAQTLDYTPTPVADKLTRLTSIWFLATSPAYYLQNLTQPFMLSLPVMSGRHDYTRAANELLRAYNELTPLMKSAAKGFNQQLDYTKLPKDVQTVISELVKRGRVDIGIDTELGRFEVEGDSKLGAGWNKVDKFLRSASQKMEAMNRLSTAIAAYRLELQKSNSAQKATEYADRILTETHGDYTRFNAPRAFNTSVGKVMLQFRKFQLIQLSLLAKLFKDAGFSTAEKRAAAKSLAYVLGHTGVMAGVAGLPGYAAIAWMLGALLGDDDDKFDLTQELRKLIGDDDIANLIMKGAPAAAGVDLSGKLGMGNALSVLPFTDVNPLDRRSLAEAIGTLVSGPAGGLAFRAADGIGQIANGNYYKGVEMLMPTGVSNMMRAYRVGTEGVTRRNGDMVMSADEVNFAESFVQALGFTPTDQAVRSERAKFVREVDQNFQDRSAKIKNDYVRAAREGDAEGKAEAREAWKKLQAARREKGYTPQPLSELLKAPQQSVKRERQVAEGVPFNKQNRQFVQQLVEN